MKRFYLYEIISEKGKLTGRIDFMRKGDSAVVFAGDRVRSDGFRVESARVQNISKFYDVEMDENVLYIWVCKNRTEQNEFWRIINDRCGKVERIKMEG